MSKTSKVSKASKTAETSKTSKTAETSGTGEAGEASKAGEAGEAGVGVDSASSVAELSALVAALSERVRVLEDVAVLWHTEVSEDVLLAIAAACAAYFGERATVKQVHLRRGSGWASQGRAAAQQSHANLHGYGDRQAPIASIRRRATT